MSNYSETLLNNFEEVNKNSEDKRKACDEFINLLRERAQYEEFYAKGLAKIAEHNIPADGTVAQAIQAFKNDLTNQATQHKLLSENISKDLVIPLKEMIKSQGKALKQIQNEGRKLSKDSQNAYEAFIKARNKYWKLSKEENDLLEQFEYGHQVAQKLGTARKDVSIALKSYAQAMKNINTYQQSKNNILSQILEVYQKQEEARIELMKDSLRKLVIYQASCMRNLQYDVENLSKACENIDASLEIATFIAQTQTNQSNNALIEFEPYAPGDISQSAMDQLKSWVENVLQFSTDEQSNFSKLIIQEAWSGQVVSNENYSKFLKIIKQREGRKLFCAQLNVQRSQGNYVLSTESYNIMAQIVWNVLDENHKSQDTQSTKQLLSLCETFFTGQGTTKKYLCEAIQQHAIWKDISFWEQAIRDSVAYEFNQYYTQNPQDTQEEQFKREKNIIFAQLGSYAHNMIAFQVSVEETKKLIDMLSRLWKLGNDEYSILMQSIERQSSQQQSRSEGEKQNSDMQALLEEKQAQRGIPKWIQDLENFKPETQTIPPIQQQSKASGNISEQLLEISKQKQDQQPTQIIQQEQQKPVEQSQAESSQKDSVQEQVKELEDFPEEIKIYKD